MASSIKHFAVATLLLIAAHAWNGPPHDGNEWQRPQSYGRPQQTSRPTQQPQTGCGYAGGPATATIDAGVLVGTSTSLPAATASVNKFLGIPYAKNPPVRFSPPEKNDNFSGPLNATTYSPSCNQQFSTPGAAAVFNQPPPVESEACLFLNVYGPFTDLESQPADCYSFAPSTPAPADGRPVLFWIYGGALQFGNAGQPSYDGSSFASYEDVIVVTSNYRLNVFGFPSAPELPATGRNLGFLDQRLALDWVQRNIGAFGGSPDKVTVFGESAGAFSTDVLLTSYPAGSKPPFRGAILQSGQYSYRASPFTSYESSWTNLSTTLGCPGTFSSDLACVRAANATLIEKIVTDNGLIFFPTPDNVTLVQNPAAQRLSGNIARIPVLGGTNAEEGRIFTVVVSNTSEVLQSLIGNDQTEIDRITARFPVGSPGIANEGDQSSTIFTNLVFQCAARRWALDTASIGTPTWRYYFNSSFTNTQAFPGLGVYHASEIQLVFNTYSADQVTTQEYALAEAMRGIWARFARNPERGPGWNQVGTGNIGTVLVGARGNATGGVLTDTSGFVQNGTFDLGVLGNRMDVLSSGVTVIDSNEVDFRCDVFDSLYDASNAA